MKLDFRFIYLLLITPNIVFAQIIFVKGQVVDEKSGLSLSGVSVKTGVETTITDKNGFFILSAQLKILREKGINFSNIGYLNTHLLYEPKHFYDVKLVENTTLLREVVIGTGEDIIKKAIKKIPENYPDKPIVIKGILRTQSWRNESEYFKSDAVVKAYIPSYSGSERTSVTVLQNRLNKVYDRSLKHVRHLSNYNVVDFQDIAHNRFILNKISKKQKFDYWLVGKRIYNNHTVFVINSTIKDTSKVYDKIDATLYIDTATYAFVAANIDIYNWVQFGFLNKKKINYRVTYEKINDKWYLQETHLNGLSEYKRQSPQTTIDFIRTEIDSINVERIPYEDIVQRTDDIYLIDKPPKNNEEWGKNDILFRIAEDEGRMSEFSVTLLDTIVKYNAITNPLNKKIKQPFGRRIVDYITNDNIRSIMGLVKFPVGVKGLVYKFPESIKYGIGAGVNLRLYRNLFLGYERNVNFWKQNNIQIKTNELSLSNEFTFNKTSRAITLLPSIGYENIIVSYKTTDIDFFTLNFGLRASYELTHKRALFLSTTFNPNLGTALLNELIIVPLNYSIGLGIVFKF